MNYITVGFCSVENIDEVIIAPDGPPAVARMIHYRGWVKQVQSGEADRPDPGGGEAAYMRVLPRIS